MFMKFPNEVLFIIISEKKEKRAETMLTLGAYIKVLGSLHANNF